MADFVTSGAEASRSESPRTEVHAGVLGAQIVTVAVLNYVLGTDDVNVSSEPSPLIVAFIDNITFHPVPEPSNLVLLVFDLIALALVTRRLKGIIERNRTG